MSMSIVGSSYGQQGYNSINVNSKQYKAAANEYLDAVIAEEAMMTPEQKMMYELMGGREAHMKNVMSNFNSDGDFIGPEELLFLVCIMGKTVRRIVRLGSR